MLIGIVAMTPEGLIGTEDGLPWHIPSDLKFFKEITQGKTLVVGHTTYKTLPPLPGRDIIVMSRNESLEIEDKDVRIVHSLEELKDIILDDELTMVAGGAEIYKLLMPFCDYFYVTEVFAKNLKGEVKFPLDDFYDLFEVKRYDLKTDEKTDTPLIFKLYKKRKRERAKGADRKRFEGELEVLRADQITTGVIDGSLVESVKNKFDASERDGRNNEQ